MRRSNRIKDRAEIADQCISNANAQTETALTNKIDRVEGSIDVEHHVVVTTKSTSKPQVQAQVVTTKSTSKHQVQAQVPKKRKRTSKEQAAPTVIKKQKASKRSAKLSAFSQVPLDVLLEIGKNLDLKTLLNLSRTTRSVQAFFLSSAAISVWKQVLAKAGHGWERLYSLLSPSGVGHVAAYIALILDERCHYCLKPTKADIFTHGHRVCSKCELEVSFNPPKLDHKLTQQLVNIDRSITRQKKNDKRCARQHRINEIVRRCVELGHDERDVPTSGSHIRQSRPLTEQAWNRMQRRVMMDIEENHCRRLEWEEEEREIRRDNNDYRYYRRWRF